MAAPSQSVTPENSDLHWYYGDNYVLCSFVIIFPDRVLKKKKKKIVGTVIENITTPPPLIAVAPAL